MNKNRKFRSSLVSGLSVCAAMVAVLLLATAALASTPQGTFEKTLQVSGPVDLEVLTRAGDVTIRAGSAGSVQIHGKIYVGNRWFEGRRESDVHEIQRNPPIRQDGNSIHIDYVNARDISVDYEITVPPDTAIRTHSGSGDQIVEGTHGNADIETGSGDVKLRSVKGVIRLQTGSGNIRAQEISGSLKGGTGSGDVEIEEAAGGDIDLRTGSGNISARGVQGAFQGETGSGDVTAEGALGGAWDIRTGSGNVKIHLPGNAAFDADISTSSGSLDVDTPVEMTVQGRVGDTRKTIRGKVRGGGPSLRVRTGSGDIQIQ